MKVEAARELAKLLLFGNPKTGSKLMQYQQAEGIDLRQKVLIWQNEYKQVCLSYSNSGYLLKRYKLKNVM